MIHKLQPLTIAVLILVFTGIFAVLDMTINSSYNFGSLFQEVAPEGRLADDFSVLEELTVEDDSPAEPEPSEEVEEVIPPEETPVEDAAPEVPAPTEEDMESAEDLSDPDPVTEVIDRTISVDDSTMEADEEPAFNETSFIKFLKETFTKGGISDITVSRVERDQQPLFDLFALEQVNINHYRVMVAKKRFLDLFVLLHKDPSLSVAESFQDVLMEMRSYAEANKEVVDLNEVDLYGENFLYINSLENTSDVLSMLRTSDYILGFQYPRANHSTFTDVLQVF